MVYSNVSLSLAEIAKAQVKPSQVLFFQLYKNKDNAVALRRIREVEGLGYKAIFLTVDAPITGNRERDDRSFWELEEINSVGKGKNLAKLPHSSAQVNDFEETETDTNGAAGGLLVNGDVDMTWNEVSLQITYPVTR